MSLIAFLCAQFRRANQFWYKNLSKATWRIAFLKLPSDLSAVWKFKITMSVQLITVKYDQCANNSVVSFRSLFHERSLCHARDIFLLFGGDSKEKRARQQWVNRQLKVVDHHILEDGSRLKTSGALNVSKVSDPHIVSSDPPEQVHGYVVELSLRRISAVARTLFPAGG